ncbi:hypothetical protein AB2B41_20845 [Marimonas sp. MJW-29]|uniref:Uncharacterized protein n=1 Tax=Sulfitobacter sediminis TaxID=3234186 RepID=A0ABV3RT21_9RHOB
MRIDEDLKAIMGSADGCSLVALGDLQTRLVLRFVSERSLTQERLNHVCAQANRAFRYVDALRQDVSSETGADDNAMMATPKGYDVFIRSAQNHTDVIFCSCNDMRTAKQLVKHAREFLLKMAPAA